MDKKYKVTRSNEIRALIERFESVVTVYGLTQLFALDPDARSLLAAKGFDDGSTTRLGRRHGEYTDWKLIWPDWEVFHSDPKNNILLMNTIYSHLTLQIYDFAKSNSLSDFTCDLCRFFRSFRNALAHDGYWFVSNPSHATSMGTFDKFKLGEACLGKPVLHEGEDPSSEYSLMPGDVVSLWRALKAHDWH